MDKPSNFIETYRRSVAVKIAFIAACAIACTVLVVFSATLGSYPISVNEAYGGIWDAIVGNEPADGTIHHIVIDLRMPKILGAVVCGFGLAVCGAAMQSMLKNPLADPYTMGISSGAGFGAALAIILGFEVLAGGYTVVNAFVFAVIPALVILFLSQFRKATPTMMILCGIALMYLFNAMTQFFMLVADPEDLSSVYKWMVGSLDGIEFGELLIVFLISAFGTLYIQYMSNQLNVMGIGDESARTLGVNVNRSRLLTLLAVTLVAASVVSFTGVIGFVGLVAPHIVRLAIGADNRYLIPASGIFGSALLLLSQMVATTIVAPQMLPVGIIMSFLGGPMFLFLILRSNKEIWS